MRLQPAWARDREIGRFKIGVLFAWFDLWVGAYYNHAKRRLYLMVPMFGIYIEPVRHGDGRDFERSPDAVCKGFERRPRRMGDYDCDTDGHYLCEVCCHDSREAENDCG